jgi:hypothetical protein
MCERKKRRISWIKGVKEEELEDEMFLRRLHCCIMPKNIAVLNIHFFVIGRIRNG